MAVSRASSRQPSAQLSDFSGDTATAEGLAPSLQRADAAGDAMRSMRWNARGFTLIELMIVVAIIGVLVSIAVPLYANVTARSRIAKAQADIRSLVTAVSLFQSHMSTYPIALGNLTAVATNPAGITAGPFMGSIPTPPSTSWGPAYAYATNANGTFLISAAGDGVTVTAP
ncbi:MAG: hypothetical protein DMD89_33655 [Candidatus Rokuibacteriota bacterium]|nr:MAG: hypothetical protein DMD89_33655 [Candidatus Rokubacteria bacterium]